MIGTRLERYEQSHRHLSAAAHIIESLSIHADAGEHLALEMVLDEARKSLGALERTISTGLATLGDVRDARIGGCDTPPDVRAVPLELRILRASPACKDCLSIGA